MLSIVSGIEFQEYKIKFTFKSGSNTFKMEVKPISERELVKMAMEELCKKAGFLNSGDMVQRDLEFLAESIESKTGVLISISTIKRLINGEFSRQPQVATLNAIAVFLNYPNWQNYKLDTIRQPEIISPSLKNEQGNITCAEGSALEVFL